MTQRDLAEAAGVSVDLVSKLEQGRKHAARLESLTRLARALDVDLAALVAEPPLLDSPGEDAGILAIRRALTPAVPVDPADPDMGDLLADAWTAYWNGHLDVLGVILPRLITDAADPSQRAEALSVTASMLTQLGLADLSYLAARQAIEAAENSTNPLLRPAMGVTFAWSLLATGRPEDGYKAAERLADDTEPAPMSKATPGQLAEWGSVLVTMATAAARAGQHDRAADAMRLASGAAATIGRDITTVGHSPFGPSQAAMQSVDVAIQAEDYPAAVRHARAMPPDGDLPLAARARHMSDMALVHTKLGRDADAVSLLLTVERMAPLWITHQNLPKAVTAELVERERRVRTPQLRSLARRLGIT